MKENITVLIVGRSKSGVDSLEQILQGQLGIEVQVRRVENGHTDPLYGVSSLPDLLILDLSPLWEEELKALTQRPGSRRLPIIAVGTGGSTAMMRMAMQAGARDFYTHPAPAEELLASVQRLAQKEKETREGSLTAVINAKGGSGASFVACSLASIMAKQQRHAVALIDMDLQFGSLPVYLDVEPKHGLLEALGAVEQLDPVALEGYMTKHQNGLHVLASVSEQMPLPWSISPKSVNRLLEVASQRYAHLIADLPRQIDPLTTTVLQRADRVLVVMQQSLTHLHDTKRMLSTLTGELSIPSERLHVIVNRYHEKSPVSVKDVTEALQPGSLLLVPNDFKRVAEAVNSGVSLLDNGRNAAITKSFLSLAVKLSGEPETKKRRFRSAFSHFLGR